MDSFFEILEGIVMFVFFGTAIVLTIALVHICIDVFIAKDNYSYVMDDGTSGIADFCDNGKGVLYCTEDGRTFTVKEFSKK